MSAAALSCATSFVETDMLALLSALLFAWGYLLVRRTLPQASPCLTGLPGPPLARAVVVLIDGLRFPDAAFGFAHSAPPGAAWSTRLIAHPPTATLPSIRSILTGGLPAFVDAGSGVLFGSHAISEDTWPSRVRACSADPRVIAFGDAAWHSLLGPGALDGGWSTLALDVGSLDDSAVWSSLEREVGVGAHPSAPRPHVAIAHANALDHAQHSGGVRSPAAVDALAHIALNLTALVESLTTPAACAVAAAGEGDTLLLVLGDHGATGREGNHGGASADETDTALVAVSVRAWCAGGRGMAPPSPSLIHTSDLAPALALLLGAPPPFSSVGRLPAGLWGLVHGEATYAAALELNARQVRAYLAAAPWAARSASARAAAAALEVGHAARARNDTAAAVRAWEGGLDAALAAARLDHATFGRARMGLGLAGLVGCAAARVWAVSAGDEPSLKQPRRQPAAVLLLPLIHAAALFSVGALQAEGWVVVALNVGLLAVAVGRGRDFRSHAALAATAAAAAFLPQSPRTAAEAMHLVGRPVEQHTVLPWALAAAQTWLMVAAVSPTAAGVAITLAARAAFHASGHFCEFAGLRMGLTGGLNYGTAVAVVVLDALAPFMVAGAAARLAGRQADAAARAARSILLAGLALSAALHARHILAPSVFAPRFLFELAFYVASWVGGHVVGPRK